MSRMKMERKKMVIIMKILRRRVIRVIKIILGLRHLKCNSKRKNII